MAFSLRSSIIACNRFCKFRSIMTSNSRIQKVMEDLTENPYYAKYAKKIAELQKSSPEEFMKRIEAKTETNPTKINTDCTKRYESLFKPKESISGNAYCKNKQLSEIFKVELVQDKCADEIKDIWLQYHIQKDVVAATIPVDIFNKMKERMQKYPVFLFLLPRSQGLEFFVCQVSGNEVHITTLLCYQVHKENAPECLTLIHYDELKEKGVILMRGEYDKNVIDGMEAQCLVNQFQMYYGQDHPTKLALLDKFTNHPDSFKHTDLINEMESIELKLKQ